MDTASSGYTLIELIVALSLVFLLGSLASASYVLAVNWLERWKTQSELENKAHVLIHRIGKDVREASFIEQDFPDAWHVEYQHKKGLTYRLSNQQLYREELLLHDSTLYVVDLELMYTHSSTEEGEDLSHTDISLHIVNKQDSIKVSTLVGRRTPLPWDVLN